ncbi:MAG: GLUG motif-containing protein, partial [Dehalococcoidia bacterium]
MKRFGDAFEESDMRRPGFVAVVFITIFLSCALLAGFLMLSTQEAHAFSGTGNGTSGDPYIITNVTQLQEMKDELYAYYALGNNINITPASLPDPDGFMPVGSESNRFYGGLDGRGYTITGLTIKRTDNLGLFGCVGAGGNVNDVRLVNANITGRNNVGALVGLNYGTVTGSYSAGTSGTIKGTNSIGGLVGSNRGTVEESYATRKVEGSDLVGGLVGENYQGTVTNSYATGNVEGINTVGGLVGWNYYGTVEDSRATGAVSGLSDVGGLVGWNDLYGTVTGSYATGIVSATSDAGGLIGENWGTVTYSYAEGDVDGTNDCVGGLIGRNWGSGTVSNSYAKGDAEGRNAVGGLVGENNAGSVSEAYASGSVKGSEDCIGGLVGRNYNYGAIEYSYAMSSVDGGGLVGGLVGENNGGSVIYSYAAGAVQGNDLVGGLVGRNYNGGTVTYCFYDQQITGQYDTGKGVPKTTAELKTITTFAEAYWSIEQNLTNLNEGYPYLSWQLTGTSGIPVWYIYNPLCPPPDMPAVPYPLAGANNVPVNVTLDWADCADASLYNVYFSTTAVPTYRGSSLGSSYSLSQLQYGTKYYWRVVAVNDCGSTWGPVWSFTTQCDAPAVPQAPSPINGSTGISTSTTLSWNASAGAISYDVYFGTTATPSYQGNT